ncbi:efflux transporter outer membrane subunit [Rhodocyclus tenuis]|uniref:efflux transporter outer membrane subunit n=1 Tax=Rhodocyclus gracilis TaxID=2929842 RepID=UPI001298C968|nr:efflux transporter outer membrane subunit [Rhodocyclus gracilis]MRD72010.1 efflux transporter outer membrane subunit [Rhodocyclus gracilis]
MKMRVLALAVLTLGGCAVGPDYHRPDVATPAAYKEAGDWKAAEPSDSAQRGRWWEVYGDTTLNELVAQVEVSNQNVLAAVAQYRQALALLGVAQAAYFPTVSGNLADTRAQGTSSSTTGGATVSPGSPIRNTTRLSYSASWEADLWGRLGRNVESNDASAQASQADVQAALLSAQATLVQSYVQLRANDAQQDLLARIIAAYQRSLAITQNRYEAGVAGRVDVAQAEAQLKSTQAQAIDLRVQRAQLEHAIAVLVGRAPADFRLAPTGALPALPQIPAALPSALLERRPDIAGAERRMASANALIGVAQAAFFPALTLSSSGGYQNSSLSQLVTAPNRFWSVGPTLALTLFDAGARSAQKASAVAAYDKSVATYRQTVLAAFQEVEDNLVALQQLAEEAEVQHAATRAALEAQRLTENQYEAGTVSYLNVVTTQATALNAQISELSLVSRRVQASAVLLKALGGGWQAGGVSAVGDSRAAP